MPSFSLIVLHRFYSSIPIGFIPFSAQICLSFYVCDFISFLFHRNAFEKHFEWPLCLKATMQINVTCLFSDSHLLMTVFITEILEGFALWRTTPDRKPCTKQKAGSLK